MTSQPIDLPDFWIKTTEVATARKIRLAVIQNAYDQRFITETQSKELLSGPLTPGDSTTIYDDSRWLNTIKWYLNPLTPPTKKDIMPRDEMLKMAEAMRLYGGGFVVALSECFILADHNNLQRLYTAFPEYVTQYTEMAKEKAFDPQVEIKEDWEDDEDDDDDDSDIDY